MIEQLIGKCIHIEDQSIVLDVNGVGYGVLATTALLTNIEGETKAMEYSSSNIWIHTHVREDQITLFGFASVLERKLFRILIAINRIGPKVAMGILSTLTVEEIIQAAFDDDPKTLAKAPKIGAAQAKKLILELKPKLEKLDALAALAGSKKSGATTESKPLITNEARQIFVDLHSALENLGYKDKEIIPITRHLAATEAELTMPELIKKALTLVGSGMNKDTNADLDQLF